MAWPSGSLPVRSPVDEDPQQAVAQIADWQATMETCVRDLQLILKGGVVLAGLTEEDSLPNCDTSIVQTVQVPAVAAQIDNPLDREPIGVINLWVPGIVMPIYDTYSGSVTVTNNSPTVTTAAGTFSVDCVYGYFTAQTYTVKIIARPNPTTITLQDPWPGATAGGINASVLRRWHSDSVWLSFFGPSGAVGYPFDYRLLFF